MSNSPVVKLSSPVPLGVQGQKGNASTQAQSLGFGRGPSRNSIPPIAHADSSRKERRRSRSNSLASNASQESDEQSIQVVGSPSQPSATPPKSSNVEELSADLRLSDHDGGNGIDSAVDQGSMCLDLLYTREIKSIVAATTAAQPLPGSRSKNYWVSSNWVSNARKFHENLLLPEVSYNSLLWLQQAQASQGVVGQGLGLPDALSGTGAAGGGVSGTPPVPSGIYGSSPGAVGGIAYPEGTGTGSHNGGGGVATGTPPQASPLPPSYIEGVLGPGAAPQLRTPEKGALYEQSLHSLTPSTVGLTVHGSASHGHHSSAKKQSKARARRGSDALPPWPEINADLVCPHGSLALTSGSSSAGPKAKKRLMAAKDWLLLRKFFSRGPSFRAKRPPASGAQSNTTLPTAPLAVTIATAALKHTEPVPGSALSTGIDTPPLKVDSGVDVCEICLRESQEQRISQQEEQQQELRRRSEAVPEMLASLRERRSGVPTHLLTARAVHYRDDFGKVSPESSSIATTCAGTASDGAVSPPPASPLSNPEDAGKGAICGEVLALQSKEAFPSLPFENDTIAQDAAPPDTSDNAVAPAPVAIDSKELSAQDSGSSRSTLPRKTSWGSSPGSSPRGSDLGFGTSPGGTSYAQMALNAQLKLEQEQQQGGEKNKDSSSGTSAVYEEMLAYQREQQFQGDEAFDVLLAAAEADHNSDEVNEAVPSHEAIDNDGFSSTAFEMDDDDFPAFGEEPVAKKSTPPLPSLSLPVAAISSPSCPTLELSDWSETRADSESSSYVDQRKVTPPSPRTQSVISSLLEEDHQGRVIIGGDHGSQRSGSTQLETIITTSPAAAAAAAAAAAGSQSSGGHGGGYGGGYDGGAGDFSSPLLPGIYFLVPRGWLRTWRTHMKEINSPPPAPVIECTRLLCHVHGLLVIPPHLEEYLHGARKTLLGGLGQYPGEVVEILSYEEWEALQAVVLKKNQNSEFGVSFSIDADGHITWSCGLCQACDPFNHQRGSPLRRKSGAGYNSQGLSYNGHNGTYAGSHYPLHNVGYSTAGGLEAFGSAHADSHGHRERERRRGMTKSKDKEAGLRSRQSWEKLHVSAGDDGDYDSVGSCGYNSRDGLISKARNSHDHSSSETEEGPGADRVMPAALRGVPPPLSEWSLSTNLYKRSAAKGNSRRRSRSGSGSISASLSERGIVRTGKDVAILLPDEEGDK